MCLFCVFNALNIIYDNYTWFFMLYLGNNWFKEKEKKMEKGTGLDG